MAAEIHDLPSYIEAVGSALAALGSFVAVVVALQIANRQARDVEALGLERPYVLMTALSAAACEAVGDLDALRIGLS